MVKGFSNRSRQGFTLIELLVVIAIIAVLAAILFPIFAQAKNTAQISKCLNNLKQLGAGIQLYVDDFEGRFPPADEWGMPYFQNNTKPPIYECLRKYSKTSMQGSPTTGFSSVGMWSCPADVGLPKQLDTVGGTKALKPIWKQTGTSYQFKSGDHKNNFDESNILPFPTRPDDTTKTYIAYSGLVGKVNGANVGAPFSAITSATKKIVAYDVWNWHVGEQGASMAKANRNSLFADGHVVRAKWTDWNYGCGMPLGAWYSY